METTPLANTFQLGAKGPASLPEKILQPGVLSPGEAFESLLLSAKEGKEAFPDAMPLEILESLVVGSLKPFFPNPEQEAVPGPVECPFFRGLSQVPLPPQVGGSRNSVDHTQNQEPYMDPLQGEKLVSFPVDSASHPMHPPDSRKEASSDFQPSPLTASSAPFTEVPVPLRQGPLQDLSNEASPQESSNNIARSQRFPKLSFPDSSNPSDRRDTLGPFPAQESAPPGTDRPSGLPQEVMRNIRGEVPPMSPPDSSIQPDRKDTLEPFPAQESASPATGRPSGLLHETIGIERKGVPPEPSQGNEAEDLPKTVFASNASDDSATVSSETPESLPQGEPPDFLREGKGGATQMRDREPSISEAIGRPQPEEKGLPGLSKKGQDIDPDVLQGPVNANRSSSGSVEGETGKVPTTFSPRGDPSEICQQVGKQVLVSLKNNQERVRLALEPPELGQIFLEIQKERGHIRATLWTDNPLTKETLELHQGQLHRLLKEDGFSLEKFDVFVKQEMGWFQGRKENPTGQPFGGQDSPKGGKSFANSSPSEMSLVLGERFVHESRAVDIII